MARFLVLATTLLVAASRLPLVVVAWQTLITPTANRRAAPMCMTAKGPLSRRDVVQHVVAVGAAVIVSGGSNALAEPQELQSVGRQAPAPDGEKPFYSLKNGVKIKVYKEGTGSEEVKPTSRVSLQCTGRLLNLNGVIFYSTKNNNPDGFGAIPLTFTVGQGQAVPGLESGIIGMKKNEIRRIIVPAELAYSKYPDLEPRPMSREEQLALNSVVKNPRRDATILFDVQVERFK